MRKWAFSWRNQKPEGRYTCNIGISYWYISKVITSVGLLGILVKFLIGTTLYIILQDALRAKRNQEQFEREWRRKQKEEAQKK